MKFIDSLPWAILILGSLSLGMAPFLPEPHLFQKLKMLFSGELSKPIDIFDFLLHGVFPMLLFLKILRAISKFRAE